MKEKVLQDHVVRLAKALGWMVYHTYDSRRSEPGFPDLVLVRNDEVWFVELKSEKGRLTPEQDQWLSRLENARTVETALWRPKHWLNSTIEDALR